MGRHSLADNGTYTLGTILPPPPPHRSRLLTLGVPAAIIALALLASGVVYLLSRPAGGGCGGSGVTATVVAAPAHADVMHRLAMDWRETDPTIDGKCAQVTVVSKPSHEVAASLGMAWNSQVDGPKPDAWAPESRIWAQMASTRPEAAEMLSDAAPSIATSPVVMAMPRPAAEALGWPDRPMGWTTLLQDMAADPSWAERGHPDWGTLGIGMADPTGSTVGLHTWAALTDLNGDGAIGDDEFLVAMQFERAVREYADKDAELIEKLVAADADGKGESFVTAFPATERDVLRYNTKHPKTPLAAVYPIEGSVDTDYPYVPINASWTSSAKQKAVEKFGRFLVSDVGRAAYGAASFRSFDQSTEHAPELDEFSAANGRESYKPRSLTVATPFAESLVRWNALRRPVNALVTLDTSGSMSEQVPGLGTKLQVLQQAGSRALSMISQRSSFGLWEFSEQINGDRDYREVVPIRQMTEPVDGATQLQVLQQTLGGLKPRDGTGLYDTILAGYLHVQANYRNDHTNILVVLTDGKNEDNSGISREELLAKLQGLYDPNRPVKIYTFAYGPLVDLQLLQEISQVTDGRAYASWDPSEIGKVFLAAILEYRSNQ